MEAACTGGNSSDYCREGHIGPYCNLCSEKFSKDVFKLCQPCELTTGNIIWTVAVLVVGLITLLYIYLMRRKRKKQKRDEEQVESDEDKDARLKKKRKGVGLISGMKILLVLYQILASLPNVIPAI